MSDFQLGALIGFGACAFLAWYCHGLFLAQMLLAGEDGTEINGVRYELCNVSHMQWLRQRAKPAPGVASSDGASNG